MKSSLYPLASEEEVGLCWAYGVTVPPVMLKISLLGLGIIVPQEEKTMPGRGIIVPPVEEEDCAEPMEPCPLSEIEVE